MDIDLDDGPLVKAPITAKVLNIFVKEGQLIEKGEKLLSLFSMKMEVIY